MAGTLRCLISTDPKIRALADKFKLTPEIAANVVAIWQERNGIDDYDALPNFDEFKKTLKALDDVSSMMSISLKDWQALVSLLPSQLVKSWGLDTFVPFTKDGSRPSKGVGYIRSTDNEKLLLLIAEVVDRKNLARNPVIAKIKWLRPSMRNYIYRKYLNYKTHNTNSKIQAIARRGLAAYNKSIRTLKNNVAETKLLIETRREADIDAATKAFDRGEFNDRVREVARLFSRIFDACIGIEISTLEEQRKDLIQTRDNDTEFALDSKKGYEHRLDAIERKLTALKTPSMRASHALRIIGGPQAVVDQIKKTLGSIVGEEKDDVFITRVQDTFGFVADNTSDDAIKAMRKQLALVNDNLNILLQAASDEIRQHDGIRIMLTAAPIPFTDPSFNPYSDLNFRETWMYEYDTIDRIDDDSPAEVRRLIAELPLRDAEYKIVRTMFGAERRQDRDEVKLALHNHLNGVYDSEAMEAMLTKMASENNMNWAADILDRLDESEALKTNFFRSFCLVYKHFGSFGATDSGVSYSEYETRSSTGAKKTAMDIITSNIKEGNELNVYSVYTNDGRVSKPMVNAIRKSLKGIIDEKTRKQISTMTPDEAAQVIADNPKLLSAITDALQAFGFLVSEDQVNAYIARDSKDSNNLSALGKAIKNILDDLSQEDARFSGSIIKTVRQNLKGIVKEMSPSSGLREEAERTTIIDREGNRRMVFVLPSFIDEMFHGINGMTYRNMGTASSPDFRYETPLEYMQRKYGDSPFYMNADGTWNLIWIRDIADDTISPGDMGYVEILDAYDKPFEKWTAVERMSMMYGIFKNEKGKYRKYIMPVTSDTQALRVFTAPHYTHEKIVESLKDTIMQEYRRSQNAAEVNNETFMRNKDKFCFLPELDDFEFKATIEASEETSVEDESRESAARRFFRFLRPNRKAVATKEGAANQQEISYGKGMSGLKALIDDTVAGDGALDAALNDAAEYILNEYFLEFFEDFNPHIPLDKNGDETQKQQQMRDFVENNVVAQLQMLMLTAGDLAFYRDYTELQKRYKEVIVPKKKLDVYANPTGELNQRSLYITDPRILSAINPDKSIVVTDGQAFRSLESHINLMHMLGTWTQEKEDAIRRIVDNKPQPGDMDVVLEVQKLFTYGLVKYSSPGLDNVLPPVQHKCSEQVLLPPSMKSSLTAQSSTLAALYRIMSEHNIDTIHFASSVKVGNNGAITMPDNYEEMSEDDLFNHFNSLINDGINAGRSPIHSIPYEYVATVSYVPEHGVDREDKISTQAEKLLGSDIPDDAIFNVGGKPMTKKQILQYYNAIWTEKIRRAYEELTGQIADTEQLSAMLHDAAVKSKRSNSYLDRNFELDAYGNFTIPLCTLSNIELASDVLNAVIRKATSRMTMNGGQFVQMTSLGLTNKLKVQFKRDSNGDLQYDYIECMMPLTSRKLIEKYIDSNGMVDTDKVPKDILDAIGYRIPTQSKSYIAPLRIVGWLPQLTSSSIVLPADIMYLNDSDYDVDKMYVLLPSFDVDDDGNVTRTPYNINKPVRTMTDGALNNFMLDIMRLILTNDKVTGQSLNAGNTDAITAIADDMKQLMKNSQSDLHSPASIRTVIRQYERNNDGKNMIAVFASANSSHAIAQQSASTDKPLQLKEGKNVRIFNSTYQSLCGMMDKRGEQLISQALGNGIGGAADNAQNPTLYWLNVNDTTAGVATLLLRLGMSMDEMALFLNIPSIRDYSRSDAARQRILRETYTSGKGFNYDNILHGTTQDAKDAIEKGLDYEDAYQNRALQVFLYLKNIANELFNIDTLSKSDTGSGVIYGDVTANFARLLQYENFVNMEESKRYIEGWESLVIPVEVKYDNYDGTYTADNETLAKSLQDAASPKAQAFTAYSFFGGYMIMQRFFPLLGDRRFIEMARKIVGSYVTPEKVRPLLESAYSFALSSLDAWKRPGMSAIRSRQWYIQDFKGHVMDLIKKHPDLAVNPLIYDLFYNFNTQRSPFISLYYRGGRDYTQAWLNLINSDKDYERKLAQELYIYDYHRTGHQQMRGSFAHYAPKEVIKSIPGLLEFYGNVEHMNSAFDADEFYKLYLRHHLTSISVKPKDVPSVIDQSSIANIPSSIPVDHMNKPQIKNNKDCWYYFNKDKTNKTAFAIEVGDNTAYYILDTDGKTYHLVTPLGVDDIANEYIHDANPLTHPSIYEWWNNKKARESLQRALGRPLNELRPPKWYTQMASLYSSDDESEGIDPIYREQKNSKHSDSSEDTTDVLRLSIDYTMDTEDILDENGEHLDGDIYAVDMTPEQESGKQYMYFYEDHTPVSRLYRIENGLRIEILPEHIVAQSTIEKRLKPDDEWYVQHTGKLNENKKYKDPNGEELC